MLINYKPTVNIYDAVIYCIWKLMGIRTCDGYTCVIRKKTGLDVSEMDCGRSLVYG